MTPQNSSAENLISKDALYKEEEELEELFYPLLSSTIPYRNPLTTRPTSPISNINLSESSMDPRIPSRATTHSRLGQDHVTYPFPSSSPLIVSMISEMYHHGDNHQFFYYCAGSKVGWCS
jgi:hypothetical protein